MTQQLQIPSSVKPPFCRGVDLYHGDLPLQFHDIAAAGCDFIIMKCSQGLHYVDPTFSQNWVRAKAVGAIRGAYHWFTNEDPIKQAQRFINLVNLDDGDLPLCLDVETEFPGVGPAAEKCAAEIKRLTGYWPIIYTGDDFYQRLLKPYFPENMHFLWIARYGNKPKTKCSIWQFSDAGRIQNVQHNLDSNVYFGTVDNLKSRCIHKP